MNEEEFTEFMRKNRRSEGTIKSCIAFMKTFEEYLVKHKDKNLEKAVPSDIKDFALWGKKELKSVNSYLWAIHRYYEFKSNDEMRRVATELRRREIEKKRGKRTPLNLKRIEDVIPEHVEKLASLGILNTKQMLEAGRTRKERQELSRKTNIPLEYILELVKLADITRISDIKGAKGRLLYEADVDTIEKLSRFTPKELRKKLMKANEEKKILKRPPTLVETTYWVEQANKLRRMVEY